MNKSDCIARLKELDAAGDSSKAAELCEAAPCSELEACQRYLGWLYFEQGDLERSHNWYSKAALQGNKEALLDCWKVILRIDRNGDHQMAMDLCETLPCSTFLDCQRYLARAFFKKGDIDNTIQWCLKVAGHGNASDLAYMGMLYRSRNEPELAMNWFKRAIAAGDSRANHLLGDIYAFGMGIPEDINAAIPYYEKSPANGFVYGKHRLLHLKRARGGILANLAFIARLPGQIINGLMIAYNNPNDERLMDVPCFKKPKASADL